MERAYRRVLAELLDDIVAGRIGAGEKLPKVDEIAVRHVCSPGAAREAIRALEERQLVEVHAGQGQTVLADDRWMMLNRDVAEATLLRKRDSELLREAVEFLRVVETQAAMLAAARAKDGDVLLLDQTLDQMRESGRGGNGAEGRDDRFAVAESEFHRALILIAGNRFLASALEPLHPVIARARRRRAADRDPSVIVQHERIVAAVSARDATAAAAAADDNGRHLACWLRLTR